MDAQYAEFVRVLGDLSRLVVLSIILERGLAFIFEHDWFTRAFYRDDPDPQNPGATVRVSRMPGLKGLIALGAAIAICTVYNFNIVGSLFNQTQPHRIGTIMTAVVLAGGSAGAIAVFQGFLNMSKETRDARIAAQQAEANRSRDVAETAAKEALAHKAQAEAQLAEAEARRKSAEAQAQVAELTRQKAAAKIAAGVGK
jgi:F0F1-type ATP synthase epsilon subunit